MHVFITGGIGIGKTTLINKLLQKMDQPVYGFRSEKSEVDSFGNAKVYLHPAIGESVCTDQNIVGICTSTKRMGKPEVFDDLGVRMLEKIPPHSVVLMDELGFLESNAPAFCDAVMHILDGPYTVIAAVKPMDMPFLNAIRTHRNARVYEITTENRDALHAWIVRDLQRLDPKSPLLSKQQHDLADKVFGK